MVHDKIAGFAELDKLSRSDRNRLFPSSESAATAVAHTLLRSAQQIPRDFIGLSRGTRLRSMGCWLSTIVRDMELDHTTGPVAHRFGLRFASDLDRERFGRQADQVFIHPSV